MQKSIFSLLLLAFTALPWAYGQLVPEKTGSKMNRSEAQAALDFHNKVRKRVSVPPLEWSEELSTYAQEWADYLAGNNSCRMEHRATFNRNYKKAGENLFWGSVSTFTPLDAAQSWYEEITDYKYGTITIKNYHKTGHYTQMIWKKSVVMGMGISVCRNGAVLIVANYLPPGNYIGEKPY